MSNEMKMSDVWGEGFVCTYGVYINATTNGLNLPTGFGFLYTNKEPAEAVCHAVNNHDRLVGENKRLREALKLIIDSEDDACVQESGQDTFWCKTVDEEALSNAEQLLSELKGCNNER
jgi:hypothetical protein